MKENIWSMSGVAPKNKENIKKRHSDIPDEEKIHDRIHGYIINPNGNIVSQFGFFVLDSIQEIDENNNIKLQVSMDGFLANTYNQPINILIGYGHPFGLSAMVEPKESTIVHMTPTLSMDGGIVISIPNDDKLKSRGINVIIRTEDVDIELLNDDIREDYKQSLEDAKNSIPDMNALEQSHNNYLKHIYVVLGEKQTEETQEVQEEFYE